MRKYSEGGGGICVGWKLNRQANALRCVFESRIDSEKKKSTMPKIVEVAAIASGSRCISVLAHRSYSYV
jgi:hypothetical protein